MKSLKAKSLAIFLVLGLLNLTAAAVLLRSAAAQRSDAVEINLAGAQRMLSQKMTKEALMLLHKGDPAALRASISRFERVLRGLESGDAELHLPATTDPEILEGLAGARRQWSSIQRRVGTGSR